MKKFSEYAAPLQEKLKVGKVLGKKGSKHAVQLNGHGRSCFEQLKTALLTGLEIQVVDPDKPFVLRCDASTYAVGAVHGAIATRG